MLLGETLVHDLDTLATFYGDGDDELDLAFNFPFLDARARRSAAWRGSWRRSRRVLPDDAWPSGRRRNHDVVRFPTRWADGDERRIRLALMLLLTLRGTPILYYGDEIGMQEAEVPADRVLDPVGLRAGPRRAGPRRRADPDAVDRRAAAPGSPPRASSRGCRSATSR